MSEPAIEIHDDGRGHYSSVCHFCRHRSPSIDTPDALRILAAAVAGRWRVVAVEGRTVVVCVLCHFARYRS